MSGSADLSNGDIIAWLRSLPADQRAEFDMIEGPALVLRCGRSNLAVMGPNRVDVHAHDTVAEAQECFDTLAEHYRAATAPDNPVAQLMRALQDGGINPRTALQGLLTGAQAPAGLPQASNGPIGMYL